MSLPVQLMDVPVTPAFVYDEMALLGSCREVWEATRRNGCKLVFSLKSFAITDALCLMVPTLDGFAASSLFEAILSRKIIGDKGSVHITTPGVRADEIGEITELCDYITFNSLSQWDRFRFFAAGMAKCGLRVNPQLSLLKDDRYNPCRKHSKLGIPLDQLVNIVRSSGACVKGITGVHFHNNCDSPDLGELLATVLHVDSQLGDMLGQLEWVNLGGGYLFNDAENLEAFHESVRLIRSKYDVEVFIEPGASIVRGAGFLVSSVLDLFTSDGKTIAVLDTTVNHMPEVFEYQLTPEVSGQSQDGRYKYVLAGGSCLAGDVFGEYSFDEALRVGSRVVFPEAGAYTLVKAHMFNGINLPTIYGVTETGRLELKKRFTYDDFASRCGVDSHATV